MSCWRGALTGLPLATNEGRKPTPVPVQTLAGRLRGGFGAFLRLLLFLRDPEMNSGFFAIGLAIFHFGS